MSDQCCPCGARLSRSTAVRSLTSPCFRMFMSIGTMKSLQNTTKVCNICRHLFYKWRRENPEFKDFFIYMEGRESDIEASDTDSVSEAVQTFDSENREIPVD
jgi:hypothetical protein